MSAEEALLSFARDLVEEIAAGRAIELAAAAAVPAQAPAVIPEPRKGAGAVHPRLGGHLLTLPGDTISGHAHALVPQPVELPAPDARDKTIAELHETLGIHRQEDLQQIAAEQAAAEAQRTGIPEKGTYAPLDDDAYAAHVARAGRLTESSIQGGNQGADPGGNLLDQEGSQGVTGQVWTPERAVRHNEMVRQLTDRAVSVPAEGKAVLAGGPDPLSRAAVLRKIPGISRYAHVSVEEIKAEMARRGMVPEVEGLSPAERSSLVHREAGHVANLALARLMAARKNVAADMPMSSPEAVRGHLGRLREHGYRVHGVFAHVPADVAAQRAADRHRKGLEEYRQGKGDGAPLSSPDLIRAAETGPGRTVNADTFDQLKPEFSSWEAYDSGKGRPVLAGKSGESSGHGITSVEDLMRRKARGYGESGDLAAGGTGHLGRLPGLVVGYGKRCCRDVPACGGGPAAAGGRAASRRGYACPGLGCPV